MVSTTGEEAVPSTHWKIAACGMVLAVVLVVGLGLGVPPRLLRDDMPGGMYAAPGSFDPPDNAQGFYKPQHLADGTTYRWSRPQATLMFPYAAQAGRYAHISLRLAADPAPPTVTIRLNDQSTVPLTLTPGFQVISARLDTDQVPNPYLDPAHIQVDIESAPVKIPGDDRPHGIMIDWVQIQPERGMGEILLAALVWALAVGGVLWLGVRRLGPGWGMVYGSLTLASLAALHLLYLPRAIPPWVEGALAGLAWGCAVALAPRQRPAWGLGLAVAGLGLLVAGRVLGDWQLDDAYISYRYAWNFVHGQGLVYNPGEPVEGYTNFLWTLLAAGAIAAGLPPGGVTLAANIALSIGLIALTWWLASRLSDGRQPWPLVAVGLLIVDDSLLAYSALGSGMESALLAFLGLLAGACLWSGKDGVAGRWRTGGGLVLALAALTRPEGFLIAAVLLAGRGVRDRVEGRPAGRLLGASILPFLAIVGPYEIWRISFYGYPFPNTFYAKTGSSLELIGRGLEHSRFFLTEHWLVVALAVAGLGVAALEWLPRLQQQDRRGFGVERLGGLRSTWALLIAGLMLYILWVGGDYFPGWRFFVPILAPLALLATEGARFIFTYAPRQPTVRALAAGSLLLVWVLYSRGMLQYYEPTGVIGELTRLHTSYVDHWGSAGLWLRQHTPPWARVAVKGAGAIAYYSQHPMLDAYGLNDLHIAHIPVARMGAGRAGHEKEDPVYVLDQHPDYILELDTYLKPVETRFKKGYRLRQERSPTGLMIDWWEQNPATRP